jgi:hypothetical protein
MDPAVHIINDFNDRVALTLIVSSKIKADLVNFYVKLLEHFYCGLFFSKYLFL